MSGESAVSNDTTPKNGTNEQTKVDNLKQTAKNSNERRETIEKRTKEKKKEKSQNAEQERSTEKEKAEKTKENNSSKQINEDNTARRTELDDEKLNDQDPKNVQQKIETSIENKSDDEVRLSKEKRSDGKETAEATQDKTSRNPIKPIDDDTNDVDHSSHTVPDNSKENEMEESSELDNNKESGQNSNEGGQKIETSYVEKNDEVFRPSEGKRRERKESAVRDHENTSCGQIISAEDGSISDDPESVRANSRATDTENDIDERKKLGTKEESTKDLNEDEIGTSNEVKSDGEVESDVEDSSTKEERIDRNKTASVTKDEISSSEIKPIGDYTKFVDPSSQVIQEINLETDTEIDFDERKELGTKEGTAKDLNEGKIKTSEEAKCDGEDASTIEERIYLIDTASATNDKKSGCEIQAIVDYTTYLPPSSRVCRDHSLETEIETDVHKPKEKGTKKESAQILNEGRDKIETTNEMRSDGEVAATKEERSDLMGISWSTKDETSESEIKPIEDDPQYFAPSSQVVAEDSQATDTEIDVDVRKELGTKKENVNDINEGQDKIGTSKEFKCDGEDASTKEEGSDRNETASVTKDEITSSEVNPFENDTKYVAPSSREFASFKEEGRNGSTEANQDGTLSSDKNRLRMRRNCSILSLTSSSTVCP
ncbi:hypothetical protein AVEN_161944-1 [Araneus ventricosus]|uniref:Uncharacterized protein n=1 Tax=Araneus ventricosus TaxID=182803 RepID=A0A4Y2HXI8_ARAVE|nr:hypothetical protein AVEN_161944-1 [Araneus ventricosus]